MRKYSFKIISVCIFLLTAAFILAGCSVPQLTKPKPDPSSTAKIYDITGECSISIEGNTITVSGKTDFDAGVLLNISVEAQDSRTLDSVTITQKNPNDLISQTFTINDKYDGVTKVVGYITCAPTLYGKHPDNIYEKYGKKFECVTANTNSDKKNYIWDNDGVVVLFASDMVVLPR